MSHLPMSQSQDVAEIVRISRHTDAEAVAEAAYAELLTLLETLSASDWAAPTACPGWSVSDMVGHLIGAARGTTSVREFARQQVSGFRHRRSAGGNPLDAVNAEQIRAEAHIPDLQRAAVLRALVPDAVRGRLRMSARLGVFTVPLSAQGSTVQGMPGSVKLGRLFDVVYTRDVWMHTVDIARATGRPLAMTAPVHRRIVEDVVVDWVDRHGHAVNLVLTGPAGGRYTFGRGGAVLELDALDFCAALSGRSEGEGLLGTKVLF